MQDPTTPDNNQAKRAVVGLRRRRYLRRLAADYGALLSEHPPEVRPFLRRHIAELLNESRRTRESDRQALLEALNEGPWAALTCGELATELNLPYSSVAALLREMLAEHRPLVAYWEQENGRGDRGRRVRAVHLTPEGRAFLSQNK